MGDKELRAAGARLRELRNRAGWTGRELARRSGVAQAAVSRLENGGRVDTNTVDLIIAALPVDADEAAELHARMRDAYADSDGRRVDAGFSLVVDAARRWERSAVVVQEFQSAMIPRALRTTDYVQAIGGSHSPLADRLGDTGCDFGFVVTEGALRTWPAGGSTMPEQLDHLARVCELPNVLLGVVPWSVLLPVMPPHGFSVFDDEAVVVETFTAQMTITEPDAVAAYVDAYAQLEAVAVTGGEARALVERIRRDFEGLAH